MDCLAFPNECLERRPIADFGENPIADRTPNVRLRVLRRFLSNDIPACLFFRPSSALRQQLHSPTMRLPTRLECARNPCAIGYVIFWQSPKESCVHAHYGNPIAVPISATPSAIWEGLVQEAHMLTQDRAQQGYRTRACRDAFMACLGQHICLLHSQSSTEAC